MTENFKILHTNNNIQKKPQSPLAVISDLFVSETSIGGFSGSKLCEMFSRDIGPVCCKSLSFDAENRPFISSCKRSLNELFPPFTIPKLVIPFFSKIKISELWFDLRLERASLWHDVVIDRLLFPPLLEWYRNLNTFLINLTIQYTYCCFVKSGAFYFDNKSWSPLYYWCPFPKFALRYPLWFARRGVQGIWRSKTIFGY